METEKQQKIAYLALYAIIGAILLTGSIDNALANTWPLIYTIMFLSTIGLFVLSLKKGWAGFTGYGKINTPKRYGLMWLGSTGLSFFWIFISFYSSRQLPFSVGAILPSSVHSIAVGALGGSLLLSFVDEFIAPLLEETWRAGTIIPSLKVWIPKVGIGPIIAVLGIIMTVLLYTSAFYIGLIVIAIGIIIFFTPFGKRSSVNESRRVISLIVTIVAIVIGSVLFGAIHGNAYLDQSNFEGALLGAIVFAIFLSVPNAVADSTMPGHTIHSQTNGASLILLAGVSPLVAIPMSLFYSLILFMFGFPDFSINIFKALFRGVRK